MTKKYENHRKQEKIRLPREISKHDSKCKQILANLVGFVEKESVAVMEMEEVRPNVEEDRKNKRIRREGGKEDASEESRREKKLRKEKNGGQLAKKKKREKNVFNNWQRGRRIREFWTTLELIVEGF